MFENKEEEEYFNFPNSNSSLTQNQSYYDNTSNIRDSLSLLDKTNEIINTRRSAFDKSKDPTLNEEEEKVNNFRNNSKNKKGYYLNPISSDINDNDKAYKSMGKKSENNNFNNRTHFNYDELAKQGDKFNAKNKAIDNNDNNNNFIINYNKNYSFGNRDTNETKSAHFNIDTNRASLKEENEERDIKQIHIINNDNNNNIKDYELVKKSKYNFNYSNNIQNNANIQPGFEDSNQINIFNDNNLNINNSKESQNFKSIDISNDNNNSEVSSNFCDSKTSIDSFKIKKANEEEKEMRVQIKIEEEKLKKLEEEKDKLIREEKERQKEILDELNRKEMKKIQMKKIYKETQKKQQINKNILKNIKKEQEKKKEEIKQLLKRSKRDEEQLKSIADLKNNKNNVNKNKINKNKVNKNINLKYMNNINNQDDDIHYGGSFNNLGNGNNMEMIKNRINKVNKFNFTNSVRLRKNNVENKNILSFDVKRTNKDNLASNSPYFLI